MSTALTIFLIIVGVIVGIIVIGTILYIIGCFISDHAVVFFKLAEILVLGLLLYLCLIFNESITLFLTEHRFAPFIIIAVVNIAFFVFMPRKALKYDCDMLSSVIYHKTTHYIDLSSGELKSWGGGSSKVTGSSYTLYGGGDPLFSSGDDIAIFRNDVIGKCTILQYNRFSCCGEIGIPDWWITRIPVFIIPFTSSIWLWALGRFGRTAPLIMHILLFTSLWFIFYNKKIYFSLAHVKAHGANKIIFWISTIFDIIVCVFNIQVLGHMQSLYLEAFGIYALFILISAIWFSLTINEPTE